MDIIERNLDKPWHWGAISGNPNLSFEFFERHLDKSWDWGSLSRNLFRHHPRLKKKGSKPSKEMQAILNELHEVFDLPPLKDHPKPVFRKGGFGYWETWNELKM